MLRPGIVLLFWMNFAGPVMAGEQYLCIGEKGTGFKWDGKQWATAVFDVASDKYVVQEVTPQEIFGRKLNFEVKRFGSDKVQFSCERLESKDFKSARILCGGLGYGMLIDTKTLRYQEVYGLGYIDGNDTVGNTPSFSIGTCSRLQ